MKKQFLLLAGCVFILASCGSNNNSNQGQAAQIDSAVNAKVAQENAANAAKNDSTLKAIEKEKAEAMSREHHEGKHESGKKEVAAPDPTPTPAPAPPPPPSPVNNRPGATGPKSVNDRPGAH